MGGVDLNDMLVEYHRSPTKARRWYMSVIGYFLDLALVNAWLLYRRHARLLKEDHELDEEMGLTEEDINGDGGKDRLMSSKQFRVSVSKAMCGTGVAVADVNVQNKGKKVKQPIKKTSFLPPARYNAL